MSTFVLLTFGPVLAVVAGFGLLWALAATYDRRGSSLGQSLRGALRIVAWVLMILGALAIIVVTTHFFAIILGPAALIILMAAVRRHRMAEQHALLWALMAAAERGIPLESAARAFAGERADGGRRALYLAEYLEAGVPLSLALTRSGHSLPVPVMLAADLGQQSGCLGPALRDVLEQFDLLEDTLRSLLEKTFYLAFLVLFGLGVLTFVMLKIVPVFHKIMEEFELATPLVTRSLINVSQAIAQYWFLGLPFVLVVLLLIGVGITHYTGWSCRHWPVFRRLWWRADCALVQRWLALAVRQKRPIAEMVRLLAGFFPTPTARVRLDRAARRIEGGEHWCVCLQQVGLIKRPESVLFRAAERAGNLAWALDEMAASSVRRSAYRLRAVLNVAFPVAVLAMGAVVLFIAVGILTPLFSLIQGLS